MANITNNKDKICKESGALETERDKASLRLICYVFLFIVVNNFVFFWLLRKDN